MTWRAVMARPQADKPVGELLDQAKARLARREPSIETSPRYREPESARAAATSKRQRR